VRAAAVDKLTGHRIFGSKGASKGNVLAALKFPRIPIEEGDLATSGAIAPGETMFGTRFAGIFGGKAGRRFHRSPASNGSDAWVAAPGDETPHDETMRGRASSMSTERRSARSRRSISTCGLETGIGRWSTQAKAAAAHISCRSLARTPTETPCG